ncbi:MAG: DUF481 domain-containing protein [Fidelibacterota bacterium]|nr:MAG: DUF481 domain-containing protein [Candidatus Neomarinimicrobiota bacterium]
MLNNWCFHRHKGYLLLLVSLMCISTSDAQVNTEAMRREDLKYGMHIDLAGNIGYTDGNSDLFQNRSKLRLDYVQDWGHAFLVANYRLGSKDEILFINKGFTHLRAVKPLKPALSGELFIQKGFNEFVQIQDRQLIGLGLRVKWHELEVFRKKCEHLHLSTGEGLMSEREQIDSGPDGTMGDPVHGSLANLIRSTNYIVLGWKPKDSFSILTTGYFQLDTRRAEDYRVLAQSTLKASITKRLALTVNMNLRYDSEPPGEVKALDIDLTNGFEYAFRQQDQVPKNSQQ